MTDREKTVEDLFRCLGAMRRALMAPHLAKKPGALTPSQWLVLGLVLKRGPSNIKAIAQALHITSSAATQLVNGLVESGLLARAQDPDDRRVVVVRLSKKAERLAQRFKADSLRRATDLFGALTDAELKQYAALNKKLADSLPDAPCA